MLLGFLWSLRAFGRGATVAKTGNVGVMIRATCSDPKPGNITVIVIVTILLHSLLLLSPSPSPSPSSPASLHSAADYFLVQAPSQFSAHQPSSCAPPVGLQLERPPPPQKKRKRNTNRHTFIVDPFREPLAVIRLPKP